MVSEWYVLQSKLHLLEHDRGFLQSNLKYLTELGNKVVQYAQDARTDAAATAEAHAREVVCFHFFQRLQPI